MPKLFSGVKGLGSAQDTQTFLLPTLTNPVFIKQALDLNTSTIRTSVERDSRCFHVESQCLLRWLADVDVAHEHLITSFQLKNNALPRFLWTCYWHLLLTFILSFHALEMMVLLLVTGWFSFSFSTYELLVALYLIFKAQEIRRNSNSSGLLNS